jgi:copper chaperone NosL
MSSISRVRSVFVGLVAVIMAGCTVEPREIHLGSEACEHCHMVIDDLRFAAQALTNRGVVHTFDALECVAEWTRAGSIPPGELHSIWASDFLSPGSWIRVEDAYFLHAPGLHSPMGAGLAAFASAEGARGVQRQVGGAVLGWAEVLETVAHDSHDHDHALRSQSREHGLVSARNALALGTPVSTHDPRLVRGARR